MIILEFKCQDCLAVFDHENSVNKGEKVSCVSCKSKNVERQESSSLVERLENVSCKDCDKCSHDSCSKF